MRKISKFYQNSFTQAIRCKFRIKEPLQKEPKPQERILTNVAAVTSSPDTVLQSKTNRSKIGMVDTVGNVAYCLVIGGLLDRFAAGLDFTGVLTSRAFATTINFFTAAAYGWWRELAYHFTKTSVDGTRLRKGVVDFLAYNTFQLPIYVSGIIAGSLVSTGSINWSNVGNGALTLLILSPFIGPTMGIFMDYFRKMFKIKSAAEGAYRANPSEDKKQTPEGGS